MRRLLLSAIVLLGPAAGIADTLLVDRAQQGRSAAVPNRGMTMSQVESQYGEPSQRNEPVGKPPISRWVYPAFTVYFEHSHVIHAVVNKSKALEQGPKPAQATPDH